MSLLLSPILNGKIINSPLFQLSNYQKKKKFELTHSELEDNNTKKYLKFKALINNTHFFFNPFTSTLFQFVFVFLTVCFLLIVTLCPDGRQG